LASGGVLDAFPIGSYQIHGQPEGKIQLTHDQNSVDFNRFGDVTTSTLVAYGSSVFELKKLAIEDPSEKGRQIWDLVRPPRFGIVPPVTGEHYRLVMSPKAHGPHRLIVYQEKSVKFILPLRNTAWERLERLRRELAKAPAGERKAVEEIQRLVGGSVGFQVESGHVVNLDFSGKSPSREAVELLAHLPHLKRLSFGHCRELTDGDLEPLQRVTWLEGLAFYVTPVTDGALSHLRNLKNLCAT
jgi:hypothetical protein